MQRFGRDWRHSGHSQRTLKPTLMTRWRSRAPKFAALHSTRYLGGDSSFGLAVSIEVTPIKNWLEIEAGVAPLWSLGGNNLSRDTAAAKPLHPPRRER
jgi:hypothetical protein